MDNNITKESAMEVLKQVPDVFWKLVEENIKLASALCEKEVHAEAEEIVSIMDARGFSDSSTPFKQKVAALLASKKDLGVVKEALALASPDLSFASLSEIPSDGDATNAFENFILGD
jgi:hypothetical protein